MRRFIRKVVWYILNYSDPEFTSYIQDYTKWQRELRNLKIVNLNLQSQLTNLYDQFIICVTRCNSLTRQNEQLTLMYRELSKEKE